MIQILLYISSGLIILAYIGYILLILLNNKKTDSEINGFDATKDILSEYNSINIVENSSIFTVYNLKRKVIKIASKCYYGSSVKDIAIPLMEAGISGVDDKNNKIINFLRKIISNLKKLYVIPIVMLFVNVNTHSLGDVRISGILLILCTVSSYMLIDIKGNAYLWLETNIKKVKKINKEKILNFIKQIIIFDKLIFFGEFIMIIRFVTIILGM